MKAIDTNIVVRFLVADDEKQAQKVRELFRRCENSSKRLFISSPVLLETLWVLSAAYELPRLAIIKAIRLLNCMSILQFEDKAYIYEFLEAAQQSTYDLSDLLIALKAQKMKLNI